MRRIPSSRAALPLLLLTLLLTFARPAGTALAHANLVQSSPPANAILDEAPTALRLVYSEQPEARFSQVRLLDRDGREVGGLGVLAPDPSEPVVLLVALPPLQPGVYTVVWRALSTVDGHTTAGAFAFVVGADQVPPGGLRPVVPGAAAAAQAAAVSPLGVAGRWLTYAGATLLAGGFAFVPLVLRPALATPPARARRRRDRAPPADTLAASLALLALPLGAGWSLALLGTLVGALEQAARSANVSLLTAFGAPLRDLVLGTRYGGLFWARLAVLALLLALLAHGTRRGRPLPPLGWWAGLLATGGLLAAISLGSHAAASADPTAATVADWVHLATAGVWAGGLLPLGLTLLRLRRADDLAPAGAIAALVGHFSRLATWCVALLALTGAYRAVAEVADVAALFDTPYGTALLVKLGLVALVLALAAVNQFLIRRRLAEAAAGARPDEAAAPWYRRVRGTVGGEVLLVAAILLATGALTSLPPAREAYGSGVVLRQRAEGLSVVLVVSPGQPGLNTFDALVRDARGNPVIDAEKVALIFTMVEHDMGENEAVGENVGAGHYLAQGGYVSMPGTWNAQLLIRRPGQDDVRMPFEIKPRVLGAPAAGLAGLSGGVVIGIEVIVAGLVLLLGARRLGRARAWAGWGAFAAGFALAGFGGYMAVTAFQNDRAVVALQNPVVPDTASIERGRLVYQNSCLACHGVSGRGDGPAGLALRPRPADLRAHMAAGHTDAELFGWVTNGVPGTAMPSFAQQLAELERWDVINFIRTFAAPIPGTPGAAPRPPRAGPGTSSTATTGAPGPPAASPSPAGSASAVAAPAVATPTGPTPTRPAPAAAPTPAASPAASAALVGAASPTPAATGPSPAAPAVTPPSSSPTALALATAAATPPSPGATAAPSAPAAPQPPGTPIAGAPPHLPPALAATGRAALVWRDRLWLSDASGAFRPLSPAHPTGSLLFDPAFSPDGRRVAYTFNPPVPTPVPALTPVLIYESADVLAVELAGGSSILVAHQDEGTRLGQTAWHPAGDALFVTRLALIRQGGRVTDQSMEIVRVDLATGATTRVLEDGMWPAVSPDGRLLAYVRMSEDSPPDIWLRELATGQDRRLGDGSFVDVVSPRFSPDGRTIAFAGATVPGLGRAPAGAIASAADRAPLGPLERLARWLVPPALAHGYRYGLMLVAPDGSNLRQVDFFSFDQPTFRWTGDGAATLAFDEQGFHQVDLATASLVTHFQPGGYGGFDWQPTP